MVALLQQFNVMMNSLGVHYLSETVRHLWLGIVLILIIRLVEILLENLYFLENIHFVYFIGTDYFKTLITALDL